MSIDFSLNGKAHAGSLPEPLQNLKGRIYSSTQYGNGPDRLQQAHLPRSESEAHCQRPPGGEAIAAEQRLPIQCSPTLSGYYGMRRPFASELDFHGTKQLPSEVYASPLAAKPFPGDSSAVQGYPPLLDPYFSDQYGDYRTPPGTSSLFGTSSLAPLLPPFPNDQAHFLIRDSWEQTMPDSLNPPDITCSDSLQTLSTATSCLPHESSGASQYRGSSWSSSLPGAQSYSLHALEDVHYASGYPGTSPYSFPSFMTVPNDLTPKMIHLSSDEVSDTTSLHDNSSWGKEDGSPVWGTYECRRTY